MTTTLAPWSACRSSIVLQATLLPAPTNVSPLTVELPPSVMLPLLATFPWLGVDAPDADQ